MSKKSKEQIFEERQKMGVKQSPLSSTDYKESVGVLNQILNKEYHLIDPETGTKYKITKEQYESYLRSWEACKPKIKGNKVTPVIYGTGGEINGENINVFLFNKKNE